MSTYIITTLLAGLLIIIYKIIIKKITTKENGVIKVDTKYNEMEHLMDFDYQDWGETL